MNVLLLAARLILAVVFTVAGVTKLTDRDESRRAALQLGVPPRIAGVVAFGLPCAELAAAGLLLPSATTVAGAAVALVLLLAFSAALAAALARGRVLDCHCFGRLHAGPARWTTLVRNGLIALLAIFVLLVARRDSSPDAVYLLVALGLLAIGLGAFLLRARQRREPRDAGSTPVEAPPFSLPAPGGELVSLDDLLALGRPVLLVVPGRSLDQELAGRLAELQRYESYAVTVALLVDAAEAAPDLEHVLLDRDGTTLKAYGVDGTPAAILVSSYGTLASPVVTGRSAIERLAEGALAEEEPPPLWEDGLPIGQPMPRLALLDLDGRPAELAHLVSAPTVLLFWRPGCRPCRGLWEDVRVWERRRPAGAPQLVIVSSGGPADTRAERFRSSALIDHELACGEAFQAYGAPMAVLVDGDRRIASRIAVGPEAVLSLLQP